MLWPFLAIALFAAIVIGLAWAYLRQPEEKRDFRFIPPYVHGILDYLVGALLIAMPWLFGFAQGGAETWVPVIVGAGAILYSLFTDYPLGVVRRLPLSRHLILDGLGGFFLFVSPFLFGFGNEVLDPFLIFGALEIGVAIFTRPRGRGMRETSPATPSRAADRPAASRTRSDGEHEERTRREDRS